MASSNNKPATLFYRHTWCMARTRRAMAKAKSFERYTRQVSLFVVCLCNFINRDIRKPDGLVTLAQLHVCTEMVGVPSIVMENNRPVKGKQPTCLHPLFANFSPPMTDVLLAFPLDIYNVIRTELQVAGATVENGVINTTLGYPEGHLDPRVPKDVLACHKHLRRMKTVSSSAMVWLMAVAGGSCCNPLTHIKFSCL